MWRGGAASPGRGGGSKVSSVLKMSSQEKKGTAYQPAPFVGWGNTAKPGLQGEVSKCMSQGLGRKWHVKGKKPRNTNTTSPNTLEGEKTQLTPRKTGGAGKRRNGSRK